MKRFIICLLIASMLLLVSCRDEMKVSIDTSKYESWQGVVIDGSSYEPGVGVDISVYSLGELDYMRKMISSSNEKEWDDYMKSVSRGGKAKKEDFVYFLSLAEFIPYVNMIEGEIIWISYSKGESVSTGAEYEIFYVTVESPSGEWVRFDYMLSVKDVNARMKEAVNTLADKSTIKDPISNKDGDITIFTQVKETAYPDHGYTIDMRAIVKGVFTRICYFTPDYGDVDTKNLIGKSTTESLYLATK